MGLIELIDELPPACQKGEIPLTIERITAELRALPKSPFHAALDLGFTNPPEKVARHVDKFIQLQEDEVAAVYAEMNGFDINTDAWFFDLFSFTEYGGHEDYDWLAEFESEDLDPLTLTGMEPLQKVYAEFQGKKKYAKASEVCSLLVIARFQDLLRRSLPLTKRLKAAPLLATAHDYDYIAEFRC